MDRCSCNLNLLTSQTPPNPIFVTSSASFSNQPSIIRKPCRLFRSRNLNHPSVGCWELWGRRNGGRSGGRVVVMADKSKYPTTCNHLRHVESIATLPSGAGNISHLNAVILGEALASEENDLVFPSQHFSQQALVPSPDKVTSPYPLNTHSALYFVFLFILLFLLSLLCDISS